MSFLRIAVNPWVPVNWGSRGPETFRAQRAAMGWKRCGSAADDKKPAGFASSGRFYRKISGNQASAERRLVRRENFRLAVFLCSTPLATPRISSGWTSAIAAVAAALSPASSAFSTFLTKVPMRPLRFPFTRVRAALLRIRFFPCGVFAPKPSVSPNQ